MDNIIAKREYGTANEMSNKISHLPFHLKFTPEQIDLLKKGIVPTEMGDRWFIFYEAPILNMHMWSGECIYKLYINEEKWCTEEIIVVHDESVKPILSNELEMNNLESIIKYSLLSGQNFRIEKFQK